MPGKSPYFAKDFFAYTIFINSIAAGAVGSGSFTTDADSDFRLDKLTFFADIAGAAQTEDSRVLPLVTVSIKDTGAGRDLIGGGGVLPIPALFGDGQIPFILPVAKIVASRKTITVALSNFSAATTYRFYLAFIGAKLFLSG